MKTKKVAVIGCGRIAGHHCRSIESLPEVEIIAVCDLDINKASMYGKEFGVPSFNNYHTMMKSISDIDLVVIATPSGMHYEHAKEVLTLYNKDLVVEKPTFLKFSRLDEIYKLAKKMGRQVFPVFQNRYNKAVQRVKNAINDGELGAVRIVSVRVRWCRPQRYYDLSEWRGTFSMDGGALTNQGIHHVDLLRYLGGEIEAVNATMGTLGAEIEVEDTVVATLRFSKESLGNLEVTTAARPKDFEASLSIVGDKGMAQIGGIAVNELQVFTPNPLDCENFSEDFSSCVYGNGHKVVYENIAKFYSLGIPYPISHEDCRSSIKLLHSFYASNARRNWVYLNEEVEFDRLGEASPELALLYKTLPGSFSLEC